MNTRIAAVSAALATLAVFPAGAHAQHDHAAHGAQPPAAAATPVLAGQSAYAALAEIVRLLEADPGTDWSRVDLERVRQHLIDMNEVVLNARIEHRNVEGGFEAIVVGEGRTAEAIGRMARAHAAQMASERPYRVVATPVDGGARVRATVDGDPAEVRKLQALGFIGLLTLGDHHGPHHLMMARGAMDGHD